MGKDYNAEAPLPPIDANRLSAFEAESQSQPASTPQFTGAGNEGTWNESETSNMWASTQSIDRMGESEYTPRQRPTGVTVIAWLNFIGAALIGLLFLLALGVGGDLGLTLLILPLDVIFAVVVGVGLLQLKNWARTLAFIGYGLNIAINVIGLLLGPVTGSTLIGIAIAVIIIWYLRQPQVAEAFE